MLAHYTVVTVALLGIGSLIAWHNVFPDLIAIKIGEDNPQIQVFMIALMLITLINSMSFTDKVKERFFKDAK